MKGMKINFGNTPIVASFWIQLKNEYPELAKIAFKYLLPVPSTYLCETGISTMYIIRRKTATVKIYIVAWGLGWEGGITVNEHLFEVMEMF